MPQTPMPQVHPIPPLFDAESRVLILGSFPSIKSREAMFFYGHPQNRFWPLLALYVAVNQISSLPWAIPRGGEQVEIMRQQARQVRAWYDGPYGLSRPTWYCRDEADEANHIER